MALALLMTRLSMLLRCRVAKTACSYRARPCPGSWQNLWAVCQVVAAAGTGCVRAPVSRGAECGVASRLELDRLVDCVNNAANNPMVGDCGVAANGLIECRDPIENRFKATGEFAYTCLPRTCTVQDLEDRAAGKRRLCLPLEVDGGQVAQPVDSSDDTTPTYPNVPATDRIDRCSKNHRTKDKHCVFVHGAGAPEVNRTFLSAFTNRFPWYWGPVHHYVRPYCKTVKFIRLPTCNYAWDDPLMLKHLCYWAAGRGQQDISQSSFGDISDTVLFAHGAGNLMIAKALHSGVCNLAPSSNWFEVQDGDHLSRMAKWNREFCEEAANFPHAAEIDSALATEAAKRKEFKGPGKKWESEERREEWRDWLRGHRISLPDTIRPFLSKRNQQRKLVKALGVCHRAFNAPLGYALSKFTFTQNVGWMSLLQNGDAAGTFGARVALAELKELGELIISRVSGSMCAIDPANARERAKFYNVKPTAWDNNRFEPYEAVWSRCWSQSETDTFRLNPRFESYFIPTSFYEATCRYGHRANEPRNGVNRPCEWYKQMACTTAMVGNTNANARDEVHVDDDDVMTDQEAAQEADPP